MSESSKAYKVASEAAVVASKVASEAASVAREVATRASETAVKVAELATKTPDQVLLLSQDVTYIKSAIAEVKLLLDNKYVTKEEFNGHKKDDALVRNVVFGFCGLILVAVIGGLMTLILKR